MIRCCDFIFALLGLITAWPLLVLVTVLARIDTRSPLFRQQRIGRKQRPFTLIKFRTMRIGTAEVATHEVSSESISKLGHFLRRTKLDELPQLWNVLMGQMSLVGPRPCLPSQQELIRARDAKGVFIARPGITGLAQLRGIDMSTPTALAETDAIMLERMNLTCYFKIIFLTLLGKGCGDHIKAP